MMIIIIIIIYVILITLGKLLLKYRGTLGLTSDRCRLYNVIHDFYFYFLLNFETFFSYATTSLDIPIHSTLPSRFIQYHTVF